MKELNHVAIILDGNGRWAKLQNKNRTYGHKVGMEKIFSTIMIAKKHNIKFLSLFCFSTENWNRPNIEVKYLMKFPGEIFSKEKQQKFIDEGIKIVWVGRRTKVPNATRKYLENIEKKTANLNEIVVNIAIDYGTSEELENSLKALCQEIKKNNVNVDNLQYNDISKYFYTKDSPNIDFLIRTGGEKRLSNFMLLQAAYAELYFTTTFWPEFDEIHFEKAIEDYYKRDRRFGTIKE